MILILMMCLKKFQEMKILKTKFKLDQWDVPELIMRKGCMIKGGGGQMITLNQKGGSRWGPNLIVKYLNSP